MSTPEPPSNAVARVARAVLPEPLLKRLRRWRDQRRDEAAGKDLQRLHQRLAAIPPGSDQVFDFPECRVLVNHGDVCFFLYQDLFVHRIYHFESDKPNPRIIDAGSNNGMSILYFKHVYPDATVIGFEPDPHLYRYLQENLKLNNLSQVELHQAGLSGTEGQLEFHSDGLIGSSLLDRGDRSDDNWTTSSVPVIRMREFLREPVDFMKMNIEGAEWDVLHDCEDLLSNINEMVIEYHHLPEIPRTLHRILTVLHEQGFEYAVSDYGLPCCDSPRPPLRLEPDSRYFRHIYAKRVVKK